MANVGVIFALCTCSAHVLGDLGACFPRKILEFLTIQECFWCILRGKMKYLYSLDDEFYHSMI